MQKGEALRRMGVKIMEEEAVRRSEVKIFGRGNLLWCKSGCSRLKMKVIRRHLKVTSRPSERGKRRRWQIVN